MTDMMHPDPPSQEDGLTSASGDANAPVHSFEALGEGSIHLLIWVAAVALISPLGNFAPFAVVFGLTIFGFAVQLCLRMPHVALPELFHKALETGAPGQWVLGLIARNRDKLQSFQPDQPHWMMAPPFDIFPRVLLATSGLAAVIASSVPTMPHVMGLVAILLSTSILARNLSIFFIGAALLSWSSVLPLISG
jgi:hypothetical protein